jgi:hypothetical protein
MILFFQNILKIIAALTLLLFGLSAISFIAAFGLGFYAMTGNCDNCADWQLVSVQLIILIVSLSGLFLTSITLLLPGGCILSEKLSQLRQKYKRALTNGSIASALILALALGWVLLVRYV